MSGLKPQPVLFKLKPVNVGAKAPTCQPAPFKLTHYPAFAQRVATEGIGAHSSHYLAFMPTVSLAQYKAWMKIPNLLPS